MIEEGQIKLLWGILPHPPGSVVRWMAKDNKTGLVWGDFARSRAELIAAARHYQDRDFYVAPNPARPSGGVRHSTRDVTHWAWLLVDLDPEEAESTPRTVVDEALLWLGEWSGVDLDGDAHVINSGRGMQAWIPFEPFLLDPATRRDAPRIMRWWLHKLDVKLGMIEGCRVDTTSSDLPRIMRCPGTINRRTGYMARFDRMTQSENRGMRERLRVAVPPEVLIEPETSGSCVGLPWQYAVSHVTRRAKRFLEEGWQEPGRHEAMWHTARKLAELGISKEEGLKALVWGNRMCRNGRGEISPLDGKDVLHQLNTGYKDAMTEGD